MRLLGLTGGIGMGKSACADLLRARAVPVVDTDVLARKVVEPGQPALDQIRDTFGPDMIGPDGRLRRGELARRVFADAAAREELESILHPKIRELWLAQAQAWRAQGCPLAVVVIPLLFETGAEKELHSVVCLACSAVTQSQRLRERGWSNEQIAQRNQAQWLVEKKMDRANFVIWTEAGLDLHAAQLDRILTRLA